MAQAVRQEDLFFNSAAHELYGSGSFSGLPLPQDLPRDLPQAEPRKREKPQNHLLTVVGCLACVCVMLLVVFAHQRLYETTCMVNSLRSELSDLQADQLQLRGTYDKAVDLVAIEQTATVKYGMSRPAAGQTVYLNLSGSDRGEVLGRTRSGVVTELCDFVCGAFENLGAYLVQK